MKADSGKTLFEFSGGGRGVGYPVAFTQDSRVLAAQPIFWTSRLDLYDAATGKALGSLTTTTGRITAAAFTPSGENIATASSDGVIRLWDVASRREVGHVRLEKGRTTELRFSPDGNTMLAVRGDRVDLTPVADLVAKGAAPRKTEATPAAVSSGK